MLATATATKRAISTARGDVGTVEHRRSERSGAEQDWAVCFEHEARGAGAAHDACVTQAARRLPRRTAHSQRQLTFGEEAGLKVNVEEGRLKVVDGGEGQHKDEGGEQAAHKGAHGLGGGQLPAEDLQAGSHQQHQRGGDEQGRLGRRVP